MTRATGVLAVVLLPLVNSTVVAQEERAAYRQAYRTWRLAHSDLERDAATGGGTVGARADKVAAEAAKYYAARKAYIDAQQTDAEKKASTIEAQPVPAEFEPALAKYAASQSAIIGASIDTIARDPDRAIQQLRQALELERSALNALNTAVGDTQKGLDTVRRNSSAAEESRGKLIRRYQALSASLKQTAQQTEQAGALWADYYRTLSDGVRDSVSRGPAPITSTAPAGVPNIAVTPLPTAGPALPKRSITPSPSSRYVGAWVYPTQGALHHGLEPQFVDLIVRDENGQARGALFVRFKLPPGNSTEPTVRFDFAGAFQSTRNQSFDLVTSNGAKGSVELVPGPASNLLEISFVTEDKPGSVRQGNFLLIRK